MPVRHERNVSKQRDAPAVGTNLDQSYRSIHFFALQMLTLQKTGRMTKIMSHEAHLREHRILKRE